MNQTASYYPPIFISTAIQGSDDAMTAELLTITPAIEARQ